MRTLLTFDANCREVLEAAASALTQQGFMVIRSFDLQGTKKRHAQPSGSWAVSDTSGVQFAVLLVYGQAAEPLPVIVSGGGRCTEVCVPDDVDSHVDRTLYDTIVEIVACCRHVEGNQSPNAQGDP